MDRMDKSITNTVSMGFNKLFSNVAKLNIIKVKKDKILFCHILSNFCHVSDISRKQRIYAVYRTFVLSVTYSLI